MSSNPSELTRQAEALLDQAGLNQPPAQQEPDEPAYRRLTDEQRATILRLEAEGLSQRTIANHLGCNVSTVNRVCQAFRPTTDLAKRTLQANAYAVASQLVSWTQTRDKVGLDAAKTVLAGAGVTEKEHSAGIAIQVIVGQPLAGTPGHGPVVEAEAKVVDHNQHNLGASDEVVEE